MIKRTVGHLAVGVVSCGLFVLFATFSVSGPAVHPVVGAAGIVAFVLAVIALRRRSWTRLPLVIACFCACALVWAAFITEEDPMAITGLAYVLYGALLVVAGAVTLVISLAE